MDSFPTGLTARIVLCVLLRPLLLCYFIESTRFKRKEKKQEKEMFFFLNTIKSYKEIPRAVHELYKTCFFFFLYEVTLQRDHGLFALRWSVSFHCIASTLSAARLRTWN